MRFSIHPSTQIFLIPTDSSSGLQSHIDAIHDPDLRKRAQSLPALAAARWAPSTTEKYERGWVRWEGWCRKHPESRSRPASPFYVALYFNNLVLEGCKYGALDTAAAAIRWGHLKEGLQNPMEINFLSITLEGAKRTIGKTPSQQKEPLSADMAKQVIDKFGKSDNLVHRRTALICLLGFSGFMRISELIAVQVKHLQFKPGHLEIFVPKAKNDQHREGHLIHIKKIEPAYCPVLALTQYLE